MKKALAAVFITVITFLLLPTPSFAAQCTGVTFNPANPTTDGYTITFRMDPEVLSRIANVEIRARNTANFTGTGWDGSPPGATVKNDQEGTISRSFAPGALGFGTIAPGTYEYMLVLNGQDECNYFGPEIELPDSAQPKCNSSLVTIPSNTLTGRQTTITFNTSAGTENFRNQVHYPVRINNAPLCDIVLPGSPNACATETYTFIDVHNIMTVGDVCSFAITVGQHEGDETTVTQNPEGDQTINTLPYELCQQIPDGVRRGQCESCYAQSPRGIWTAIGCIPATSSGIVRQILTIGLSLAGGAAILLVLASGFLFTTSQGDPKRTGEAREMLTSAVIGLLFIIFSVTILQFIGVTLFRLPGFGG